MRAIVICVDYHYELALTLPSTHKHFDSMLVLTSPGFYTPTCTVCMDYPNVKVMVTDLFYREGAHFAKYRALEWGLDQMGRTGWICHLDADIVWPSNTDLLRFLRRGYLYSPLRRMCDPVPKVDGKHVVPPEEEWGRYHVHPQTREWAGYTQIYHAEDPRLGTPPWHQIDWTHAGGGDSFFQAKWPDDHKVRLPWHVLHLGPSGSNWCGRATPRLDGSTPPEGATRVAELRSMIRKRSNGSDRFRAEKIQVANPESM